MPEVYRPECTPMATASPPSCGTLQGVTARPLLIAIDGPAGAGKSATARELAQRLELPYLDTGAMYRAVALSALRAGLDHAEALVSVRLAAAALDRAAGRTGG